MQQAAIKNLSQATLCIAVCEPALTLQASPAVVLDTNVVLDWLLFGDPAADALSAAIVQRQVRWVATAAMRDEFAAVLQRGLAAARGADIDSLLAVWDAHVDQRAPPSPTLRAGALTCADPDDQIFLDLAQAATARWLISRDRAVLRLARRAAQLGIAITAPQQWPAAG